MVLYGLVRGTRFCTVSGWFSTVSYSFHMKSYSMFLSVVVALVFFLSLFPSFLLVFSLLSLSEERDGGIEMLLRFGRISS